MLSRRLPDRHPMKRRAPGPQRQQTGAHTEADPVGPIHFEWELHDIEIELPGLYHLLAKQDDIVEIADRPYGHLELPWRCWTHLEASPALAFTVKQHTASLPVAQRIDGHGEGRGGLTPARVIEVVARIRLTPVFKHPLGTPLGEMGLRHVRWMEKVSDEQYRKQLLVTSADQRSRKGIRSLIPL